MKNKKVVLIYVLSALLGFLVLVYVIKDKPNQNTTQITQEINTQKDEKNLQEYERFFALPKHDTLEIDKNVKLSGDIDELKAQILELRAKNKLLYDDNLGLVNKNYEIALALDDEKAKIKEIKHQLQTKNLEAINESEKQHYQNINELTKRINELQKENLNTVKDYEQKLVNLENEIEKLQTSLRNKDMLTNDEVAKATKSERVKNSSLAEKNLYLINEIEKLKQNSNIHTEKLLKDISSRKLENEKLKNMILEKENLINQILAKHTAEIIEFDKKAQAQIKKLKDDNNKLKQDGENDINSLKELHQKEISTLNEQMKKLINDKNNTDENTKSLIVAKKDEQIALLQTQLAKQKSESSKSVGLSDKDKQNYKILNDKIILLERQNKELRAAKDGLNDNEEIIRRLNVDNQKLQEQNNLLQDELKQSNVKLSVYASKDYDKIINEQNEKLKIYQLDNETLKTSLQETENMLSSVQKQLEHSMSEGQAQDYENKNTIRKAQKDLEDLNVKMAKIEKDNKELIKENAVLKMKSSSLKDYEDTNAKLNKQISSLKNENEQHLSQISILKKLNDEYKLSLDDKNSSLNKANSDLSLKLNDAKKQIINLTAINEENQTLIKNLKAQNTQDIQKESLKLKQTYDTEKAKLVAEFEKNISELSKINQNLKTQVNETNAKYNELKAQNLTLSSKLEDTSKTTSKEVLSLQSKNEALVLENKDLNQKIKSLGDVQNEIFALNTKFLELQKQNSKLLDDKTTLQNENALLKTQAKIDMANLDKQSLSKINDLTSKLNLLENKHKLLEDKYTKSKEDISRINLEKANIVKQLEESKQKEKELALYKENSTKKSDTLVVKMGEYEEQIAKTKADMSKIENQKNELLKQNESLVLQNKELSNKLEEIAKSSSLSNDENTKLLAQSTTALKQMQDRIKELEGRLSGKLDTPKTNSKHTLIKTIVCDDLKSGQKDLSKTCKANIQNALKTAQSSDIYEIEAVVDDDGFTSLNTLKRQGIIPQSEFERLTKFANFGLGRDRGEKASEFIKSINKDANVYLSKELTIKPNKRGFILKIYR